MKTLSRICSTVILLSGVYQAPAAPESVFPTQAAKTLQKLPAFTSTEQFPTVSAEGDTTLKPVSKGQESFLLKEILIDGRPLKKEEKDLLSDSFNREVSWDNLQALARRLIRYYRDKGFLLAKVTLPHQEVKNGIVHFHLALGHVGSISYRGKTDRITKKFEQISQKLLDARPLTKEILERCLLLMNGLPGVSVQMTFDKSKETFETVDLIITVNYSPISGSLSINNDGTQYIGPLQGMSQISGNNLFNKDDKIGLSIGGAPEDTNMLLFQGSYDQLIGDNGLNLSLMGSNLNTRPSGPLSGYRIRGSSSIGQIELTYPVILNRYETLQAGVRFQVLQAKQDTWISTTKTKDNLRILSGFLNYDFSDRFGAKNLIQFHVSKGITMLWATSNSSKSKSTPFGRADFLYGSLLFSRDQALWRNLHGVISFNGQWAANPLLSSQQFSIGGAPFDRTYPSIFSGDSGAQLKIEFNYGFLDERIVPYAYFTLGKVWNRKITLEEKSYITLEGRALGLRSRINDFFSGYIEWDTPLRNRTILGPVKNKISVGVLMQF